LAAPLSAENVDKEKAIDASRTIIKSERESFVSGTMKLSEEERLVFWPIYTAYRADRDKLTDRAVQLVADYMNHYGKITNEQAQRMLNEFLDIRKAELELKKTYVKRFNHVLEPRRTLKFFQMENRLDAVSRFQLTNEIPLAK
jgi:polyhydroxyalkanoate synthesis regulator phasin